jgi:hypothetical protein
MAESLSEKVVLVCLGERKRRVKYTPGENEVETILDSVRSVYGDLPKLLRGDLVLQIKNEDWGEFVDLAPEDSIPNRSVLRVVPEVSLSVSI